MEKKSLSVQMQHRISQTYLKQFGYVEDGKNFISVLNKQLNKIEPKSIKSFSSEPNIFDLPLINSQSKLEELNRDLENDYPKIISELHSRRQLSSERTTNLLDFFPNILCRTKIFSEVIQRFLESDKREIFFNEISSHNPEMRTYLDNINKLRPDQEINLVLPVVMDYLSFGFQRYNFIYLTNKRGWATCDNPVMFIQNGNGYTLLHTEIEIYFPLSRDFLLYVYHPKHHRENDAWSKHPANSVVEVDEKTATDILNNTFLFAEQFLIFPLKMEKQWLFPADGNDKKV